MVLVIGIKESANFNSAIVFVKLAAVLICYCCCRQLCVAPSWPRPKPIGHPFIPPNTGTYGIYGWSGIARAPQSSSSPISVLTPSQPRHRKRKTRRKTCRLAFWDRWHLHHSLHCGFTAADRSGSLTLNSMCRLRFQSAMSVIGVWWGSLLVNVGAICRSKHGDVGDVAGAIASVLFHVARRLALEVGRGNSPASFRTPWKSTIIVGIFVAFFAALIPIRHPRRIGEYWYAAGLCDCLRGRLGAACKRPDMPRPFKTPWVPFTPIARNGVCVLADALSAGRYMVASGHLAGSLAW